MEQIGKAQIAAVLAILLLLLGCGSVPPTELVMRTYENGVETTTHYSPYMEMEQRSDDKVVLSRLVVSLGSERVPAGYVHEGPFADDLSRSYRDGIIEWVSELYLINTSDSPIEVELVSVSADGKSANFGTTHIIPAGKWYISPPLIELHSNFGTKTKVEYAYRYLGKLYEVKGMAERLTIEEVEAKYSP